MLRLVGGTDVKTDDERATVPVATPPVATQERQETIASRKAAQHDDQARRLVMAFETGTGTVGELIKNENSSSSTVATFASSGLLLSRLGIVLSTGGLSLGMSQDVMAT